MLKESILEALREKPHTIRELSIRCDAPESSIRARLSEIRRGGFKIDKEKRESIYYTLSNNTPKDKLLNWLKENNMFEIQLNINDVSRKTGMSIPDIESALSEMFTLPYDITQMSKETFIVRE